MDSETRHVGPVEVTALIDSAFPDEPMVESFLGPADALMAAKDTYPGVYTPDDRWLLRIRCWLLRHPGGLVQRGPPGVENGREVRPGSVDGGGVARQPRANDGDGMDGVGHAGKSATRVAGLP